MLTKQKWDELYPDIIKTIDLADNNVIGLSVRPVFAHQSAYHQAELHKKNLIKKTNWVSFKAAILARVNLNCETFYSKVLNRSPKYRSSRELRYFNEGSFKVDLNSKHEGRWTSFEAGYQNGNAIDLLMNSAIGYGLDFKAAVRAAAKFCGISEADFEEVIVSKRELTGSCTEKNNPSSKDRLARIKKIVSETVAINNTIGERYLTEHRGIIDPSNLSLRFHPEIYDGQTKRYYPALIVVGYDEQGEVACYQSTLLDPQTAAKLVGVDVVKRSHGRVSGSVGLIQKRRDSQVILAEGNETAASIALAYPDATVYSLFGSPWSLTKLSWLAGKHKTDTLYFAADNDGCNLQATQGITKALSVLNQSGITLKVAMPELLPAREKTDWNDCLLAYGVERTASIINKQFLIYKEDL